MEKEIIRTLRPFSDLKSPTNTIYDHLPYKKDINLVKESDVRLVSGNIVKNIRLVPDEPIILNTNPLANDRIEESYEEHRRKRETSDYVVEEYSENELLSEDTDALNSPLLADQEEPVNSFAGIDEDDNDYSFLLD